LLRCLTTPTTTTTTEKQLAGPASGIGIVDTTKLAVNTLKVISVLQGISEDLKVPGGGCWVPVWCSFFQCRWGTKKETAPQLPRLA